jgi:hypothetical protein
LKSFIAGQHSASIWAPKYLQILQFFVNDSDNMAAMGRSTWLLNN